MFYVSRSLDDCLSDTDLLFIEMSSAFHRDFMLELTRSACFHEPFTRDVLYSYNFSAIIGWLP